MKKLLCVLLCAVLLMGVLVSCKDKAPDAGNDGGESQQQTPAGDDQLNDSESGSDKAPADSETNKKPVETETRKDLVVEDFSQDGVARDFNMMVRQARYHYLYTEKDSAEQLAHGVYLRNTRLENDYGIKIKIYEPPIPAGSDAAQPASFINALSASTGEFDLCVPDYWWLLEHQGFFINLFEREELGFNQGALKQDYWYTQWNDNTTINNRLYTVVGDASLEVLENIEVVYYNKGMTDSVEGGIDMYALVDDHAWTLDEMNRIGKLFATGAETQTTDDDVYGAMYDIHSAQMQLFASGIKLTEINDQGGISLVAKSRGINSLIHDKIKSVVQDPANIRIPTTARGDVNKKVNFFVNNQVVFYADCLYNGRTVTQKAADGFEFGIVPQPLYQEGDEYISTSYGVSVFGIPKSFMDLHFSAVVLDAMNYHSWNTVVSAFFDATMKAQLAAGSNDARMLDLARNNLYFDFAWILDTGGKMTVYYAFHTSLSKDKELSSALDSALEVSVPGLGEIMMFYNQ